MKEERGNFSSKLGFILAAAGSAVGLGNLWRFPYLAAQYGGGIFLFVYLILVLTFGFSMLAMEVAIGRKTKVSGIKAYTMLHKKFGFLGYIAALIPMIILPYYSVIGGWVIKYMLVFFTGEGKAAAGADYFGNFVGGTWSPLIMFAIFLIVTTVIVLGGVQKGVERASTFLMPVLVVITVGICVYICTIPNAWEGIKYYLLPDFSKFSFKTICAAMGQLFYSMSIAMGIMVSYGSYVSDETDLGKSVNQIEVFDTAIAVLSGFMIVPAVYIFSGEAGLKTGGAGLMFKTLPMVFDSMPAGQLIGGLFFVLVLFAALTSSISIMEAVASNIIDKTGFSRTKAVLIVFAVSIVLGIPSSMGHGPWAHITILGMDFLTFFDYISNSVMMPIVAICTCILIGWVVGTKVLEDEITKNGEAFPRRKIFQMMVKYIAPVCLIIILVFYSLVQFGFITY
ncbi:MAG: sodium-dependent transporter [Lachnospiraceae bacterium]|nr:sodium-dependent transporter [Lachnospiraceae bacterium]